jgi:hypothetical protein
MSEIGTHAETVETAPHGPLHRRIVEVFVSPFSLFRRFGPKAPWVDAMLVAVVLSAIAMALVPADVWLQTVRDMMAANPQQQGMSPEQMASIQRYTSIGGALVVPWIMLFVQGGILLAIFTMLMGGEATYRQYLAVSAHAGVVGAVGQLVTLPLIIGQGSVRASISLAPLAVGMGPDDFLYRFLGAFNVFIVWQVVVMALGIAAINRRRSATAPLAVLFGIFAVIAVLVAYFTAP